MSTLTNSTGVFTPINNTVTSNNNDKSYSYNGFLIALEVVFSVIVIFILLFCFYAGIRKKQRLQREKERAIESAIYQQESKFLLHLEGRCHSSSTIITVNPPPPRYTPPDSRHTLPKDALTRLDCLLSQNQICTKSTIPTQCVTLPQYSSSQQRY